jgi:transcriptional regulator with PAS, ATPase and Fis domain
VEQGRFRADLFYRLNVFPVQIPALRDRIEDLPLLAGHFLEKFHAQYEKRTLGLSDKALSLCMSYHWPGNIRELENVIERGVILTDNNETISQDALFVTPPATDKQPGERIDEEGNMRSGPQEGSTGSWSDTILDSGISLDEVEETLMRQAMEQASQNVSKAARLLGLTRPALAYRLKKSGILAES